MALTRELDGGRSHKAEVGGLQRHNFLHACSRVEHQSQEHVVPSSGRAGSVDAFQNGAEFVGFEVIDTAVGGSFERHVQHALGLFKVFRIFAAEILKEAVDRAQPHVARGRPVATLSFQAVQEGGDCRHVKVGQRQLRNTASLSGSKLEQELQTVAITKNGVDAVSLLVGQIFAEKSPQSHC